MTETLSNGARDENLQATLSVEADEDFLTARDGLKLRWRSETAADGATKGEIAIVHGYGEHLGRYDHVAEACLRRGFGVHRFEYRGHGRSQGRRTHIDRFDDYLDDLDAFVTHVASRAKGPITLVGHSLGGLMVARWLQTRGGHPIARAVLSAPFVGLAFAPPVWKRALSKLGSRLFPALRIANGLTVEQLTSDEEKQRETAADPLYLTTTTPRWFCEVTAAQEALLKDGEHLTAPFLMLLGERDPIASPEASRRLFEAAQGTRKALITFDDMRHELFNERDRASVLAALFDWLERPLSEEIDEADAIRSTS